MEIIIESGQTRHLEEILDLYRRVAVQRDGIIRHEHEITRDYIQGFLEKSLLRGLILLARKDTKNKILTRELTFETPIHMAWFNAHFDPAFVTRP